MLAFLLSLRANGVEIHFAMTILNSYNNVALAHCVLFSELLTQGVKTPCCQILHTTEDWRLPAFSEVFRLVAYLKALANTK